MAVDIAGLVGAENMTPAAKEKVIALLHDLQQPATTKRFLYSRWARLVGVVVARDDIDRVALWNQGAV
jgi:hypothetical protein